MARPLRAVDALRRLPAVLRARLGGGDVGPIGFELGREHVRLLQLERRGEAIDVRAATSRPAPGGEAGAPGETLRALVRDALGSQPFRGRRVVTVLPAQGAKLMVLNYEIDEPADEPQRVLGLVQERIDEPIEECVVDYQPIRTGTERKGPCSALVAVARQAEVIDYLERLRTAGLEVAALEIVPVAVQRLLGWLSKDDLSSHSLVLHCGQQRTHLIGLAGRRLVLYRDVEFGAAPLVEALAKALDQSRLEALAMVERYGVWPDDSGTSPRSDVAQAFEIAETLREILRSATHGLTEEIERAGVYTASQWRGAALERIYVLGAFARWPGMDRLIESLVSIPTHVLDPVAAMSNDRNAAVALREDAALVMGLALRGLVGDRNE